MPAESCQIRCLCLAQWTDEMGVMHRLDTITSTPYTMTTIDRSQQMPRRHRRRRECLAATDANIVEGNDIAEVANMVLEAKVIEKRLFAGKGPPAPLLSFQPIACPRPVRLVRGCAPLLLQGHRRDLHSALGPPDPCEVQPQKLFPCPRREALRRLCRQLLEVPLIVLHRASSSSQVAGHPQCPRRPLSRAHCAFSRRARGSGRGPQPISWQSTGWRRTAWEWKMATVDRVLPLLLLLMVKLRLPRAWCESVLLL